MSRVIGGIVRSMMLFLALLWAIVILVFGILIVVLWPFIPVSIVILPFLTITGTTVL